MTTPILATKLYTPMLRSGVVLRPRLIDRINQGLRGKLILISAPAGFGKTTLVSEWVNDSDTPVAWLSLDEGDSDPVRFITYLVSALQTIAPNIGDGAKNMVQSPQPPPIDAVMTTLLNEIFGIPQDFALVLDDYHVLDSQQVDAAIGFLIEHLPPQMHILMTTREDPRLPLARLRVQGQLTELRAADLRFTQDEAANFLNQVMGLNLSAEDIAALEGRTEGWIAGLQLAALSLEGRTDTAAFIESFTGSHHFVLDYLVEEVLHQQSEATQAFLLQTSVLERMCGPLCDAVIEDAAQSSQSTLEALQQANLFLIPLDNERQWYRYHHLFSDLLRQRLQQQATQAQIDALHLRASVWYEQNGLEVEAFQHAAASNNIERTVQLIEGADVPLHFRGAARPVLHWLDQLPKESLNAYPELWVTYASALTVIGQQINTVEDKLQAAEAALEGAEDTIKTRDLRGHIAATRSMLAGPRYDIEGMRLQAQQALELLSPDNLSVRTMATWSMGLAHQYSGNRIAAKEAYSETVAISEQSHNVMVNMAALTCLGQMQEFENQLYLAEQSYQQVIDLVGKPPWPTTCEAYLGLARLHYQWNVLDKAAEYAQMASKLGGQIENVDTPVACGALLARIQLVYGNTAEATATLTETEQFAQQRNFLNQLPLVYAQQVRVLLKQGNIPAALQIIQTHDLPVSNARIYLAQQDFESALSVLEGVYQETGARNWQVERLEAMVLQAITYAAQNDIPSARQKVDAALQLAAPGRLIRMFVDEGPAMHTLLLDAQSRGVSPDYVKKLLSAFDSGIAEAPHTVPQPLIEPLSDRELEILQMVADGLSNREISDRLYLALSTVKGHNRNIFDKLQVKRRTEAVARAHELGLIE